VEYQRGEGLHSSRGITDGAGWGICARRKERGAVAEGKFRAFRLEGDFICVEGTSVRETGEISFLACKGKRGKRKLRRRKSWKPRGVIIAGKRGGGRTVVRLDGKNFD